MTAPGVEVIRAELEAWNAGVKRCRDEYRNRPTIDSPPTVCLTAGCDNDRAHDRPRCSLHQGEDKERRSARNARYRASKEGAK